MRQGFIINCKGKFDFNSGYYVSHNWIDVKGYSNAYTTATPIGIELDIDDDTITKDLNKAKLFNSLSDVQELVKHLLIFNIRSFTYDILKVETDINCIETWTLKEVEYAPGCYKFIYLKDGMNVGSFHPHEQDEAFTDFLDPVTRSKTSQIWMINRKKYNDLEQVKNIYLETIKEV